MKHNWLAGPLSHAAATALGIIGILGITLASGVALIPGGALAGAPARSAGKFSDVPRDHWAYEAISELYSRGIIRGYPDSSAFKGEKPLTRYEMAVALKHLIENLRGSLSDLDPDTVLSISKLTREYEEELTEMKVKLDIFKKQLSEFFTLLRTHEDRIGDHETRLGNLESDSGGRARKNSATSRFSERVSPSLPGDRPWAGPFEGGRFALGAKFGFYRPDGGDLGSMFGSRETLVSGEVRFFMTPRLAISTLFGTWKNSDTLEVPEIMPGLKANTSVKLTPWFLRGLFFTRPGRAFNPYFGVGFSRVKSELFYADAMRTINSIATDNGVTLCAGLEYFLTRSFSLTTEMNLLLVDGALGIQEIAREYDVDLDDGFFTTGLNVYFK